MVEVSSRRLRVILFKRATYQSFPEEKQRGNLIVIPIRRNQEFLNTKRDDGNEHSVVQFSTSTQVIKLVHR